MLLLVVCWWLHPKTVTFSGQPSGAVSLSFAMDVLLARLGAQAMNMALRSGLAFTSTYAIGQCSRLLKTVDDRKVRSELRSLQDHLNSKINILSPVIDLIEFK